MLNHSVEHTSVERYLIHKRIAEGGMGTIYLGSKVGSSGFTKEVVLKQLLPEHTSQPELTELFIREARLSALLEHNNIVRTLDLVANGTNYFIVMEYVRGADLQTILKKIKARGKQLSVHAALYITKEILSALDYAHQKQTADGKPLNLIHRDISPSNIMISDAGEVKLTDFGIAKVSTHNTVFYRVKGKAGYMSPEQAHGNRPIDGRSDLFALGIVLYEMLCGQRLFVVDFLTSPDEIYKRPVPKLETSRRMPQGIDALIAQTLSYQPHDRFLNAKQFQEAIVTLAQRESLGYTAADLATHLRELCGPPERWSTLDDVEEPHGTLIISDDAEASQAPDADLNTGTALTSVLFEENAHFAYDHGPHDTLVNADLPSFVEPTQVSRTTLADSSLDTGEPTKAAKPAWLDDDEATIPYNSESRIKPVEAPPVFVGQEPADLFSQATQKTAIVIDPPIVNTVQTAITPSHRMLLWTFGVGLLLLAITIIIVIGFLSP